ncbi:CHAT domain-containing protein [Streptomyces sp. NPDC058368]|uniref:CHAT domain-containing protein n=1 Tax=Streptomyces sp. NPDC058368 TaxID=3346461 RepID=UPI00366873A4
MKTMAARLFRRVFEKFLPQRPGQTEVLGNRAVDLLLLHQRTGQVDVLEEAVDTARQALAVTPDDHPHRAAVSDILAVALLGLFERTGDVDALEEAVEAGRRALAATPRNDPRHAGVASNYGMTLRNLFECTGRVEVLEEAIETGRHAVATTIDGDPGHVKYLSNLGAALLACFERTGQIEVLEEAIGTARQALAVAPADSPDKAALLANLAPALVRLFECTGRLEVLEEAIGAARQALASVARDDPKRAGVVSNLGMALVRMFERTGQTDVLEEAIETGRQTLANTPHNGREGVAVLNMLLVARLRLFERTGSSDVLEEAIETGRQALAAIPLNHRGRADILAGLGVAQRLLFDRTDRIDVLVEAIETGRRAAAATPVNHPNRADNYANLGATLLRLFQRNGRVDVLQESIEMGRLAVAISPLDQPKRTMHLYSLGAALNDLFDRTGSTEALHEACRCFREAADSATGEALLRVMGYRRFAHLAIVCGSPDAALRAIEDAVELMAAILPSDLARSDREHQIGRLPGLAAEAAAAALAAGQPTRAVELLERTRGLLAADAHAARGPDMVRLRRHAPHLADELEQLRGRLSVLDRPQASVPLSAEDSPWSTGWEAKQHLSEERRDAYRAWHRLLHQIRSLPGFTRFFQAPALEELVRDAQGARVVFITVGSTRCDALILPDDAEHPVQVVPLDALTQRAAMEHTNRLFGAVNAVNDRRLDPVERVQAQQEIFSVMAWMWDTITEPVLTHLGHVTKPGPHEPWPRVRWCPVGFLAYLPFHAAGYHMDDPDQSAAPRAVMDRVVSSYTTTVRALAQQSDTDGHATLIVPVADIPGAAPLPAVHEETRDISALVANAHVLTATTRDAVLRALPDYQIVHFACHGSSGWADPARSCLLLSDHEVAPLTISDIGALGLTADLAYLSACYTSITSPLLVDESLHITGAFQLAGYQHVIGTLWQVNDRAAAELARDFYAHLTDEGEAPPRTHRSPQALHHAVRRQRARYPNTPTLWAAHTHTGR